MTTGGKEEMDELFPVRWSKDDPIEDIGGGNEDKEEGDQGQASSKRQRTEIKQEDTQEYEHVWREDADDISLEIDFGNMSKSGRLNGGGDAVAQFEHDWKEDRDQVRLAPHL